jgi:DNA-binding PadR family transcriptional regulator
MSTTRLLVLGAVRIFQPVHGYFVRRELLSWRAEEWAHLNPGSIYNALRTLAREGFLEEVGTDSEGGRPARTSYSLTQDGETELFSLLRKALWTVSPFDPSELLAAWSFSWMFKRDEVIAAFEQRLARIAAFEQEAEFALADLGRDPGKPAQVAEHYRLTRDRLCGEAVWLRSVLERLRGGEYWFDGEPDPPFGSAPREQASRAASPSRRQVGV